MASVRAGDENQEKELKSTLSLNAMKGKWDKVIKCYQDSTAAHTTTVTSVGDTALHLAIFDDKEVVRTLVGEVTSDVLKIKNDQGSTPLHLAAALGSATMCRCIAVKDPELAGCCNKNNENPIFTAVLHGKLEAYRALVCIAGCRSYAESRRKDGDTILHAAIGGEFIELAFEICHHFEGLMTRINENGLTPLHLLASKPHAFRSGSHQGLLVNDLKPTSLESMECPNEDKPALYDNKYPKNYETCFLWLEPAVKLLNRWKQHKLTGQSRAGDQSGTCPWPEDIESQNRLSRKSNGESDPRGPVPPNWNVIFACVRFLHRSIRVVLGIGSRGIEKIEAKKQKNRWSVQLLQRLLDNYQPYDREDAGSAPYKREETILALLDSEENLDITKGERAAPAASSHEIQSVDKINNRFGLLHEISGNQSEQRTQKQERLKKVETPILIAAKNGITEIVDKILDKLPVAIHDSNTDDKNIVHLAVEHRQPQVFKLLKKRRLLNETLFGKVDSNGNSTLHLAAMVTGYRAWNIPGEALQMQWEIKWYEYVKDSMPLYFFVRYNKAGKTPRDIFTESHMELMQKSIEWLKNTSSSCSVVAALIATVAFATSSTVPGGNDQGSGRPTLESHPGFKAFTISSLAALCFSVTSLLMFLSILTSRHQEKDFGRGLPRKLLLGLSSLFVSVGAILVSFCAADSFVLSDQIKFGAIPVYTVTCLPMTIFALAQFPLYVDLLSANFRKLPLRSYKSMLYGPSASRCCKCKCKRSL